MTYEKLIASFLGLGLLAGLSVVGAQPKAPSTRSLNALMDQAGQAVLAGEYKAARDDYSDILHADPHNQTALQGAAFAYLSLDDFVHAKACFEKSQALSSRISRASAINGAAIYLQFKIPMRSVKILMQYMKPMQKVDELALNALAVSLNQVDVQGRKSSFYAEAVKFYEASNDKLEETRPGEKRWGTQWLSADEADEKKAAWLALAASTSSQTAELAALKSQLDAMLQVRGTEVFDATTGKYIFLRGNEYQVQEIQLRIDAKQAEFDKTTAGAQRPPIPSTIRPLNIMEENTPTLADASGSKSESHSQIRKSPKKPAKKPAVAVAPQDLPPAGPASSETQPPAAPVAPDPGDTPKQTYRVTMYAAAFPVAADLLITSADAVADASDIQVQDSEGVAFSATLVRSDPETGLALIRVAKSKFAYLPLADQFAGGALTCVGFPNVDLFQPTGVLIHGSAVAPGASWKVHLAEPPRLGGGPLLAEGKVVGVELAARDSEASAIPSVTLDQLKKFIGSDAASGSVATEVVSATFQLSAVRLK